jgi:hypothetical protein
MYAIKNNNIHLNEFTHSSSQRVYTGDSRVASLDSPVLWRPALHLSSRKTSSKRLVRIPNSKRHLCSASFRNKNIANMGPMAYCWINRNLGTMDSASFSKNSLLFALGGCGASSNVCDSDLYEQSRYGGKNYRSFGQERYR